MAKLAGRTGPPVTRASGACRAPGRRAAPDRGSRREKVRRGGVGLSLQRREGGGGAPGPCSPLQYWAAGSDVVHALASWDAPQGYGRGPVILHAGRRPKLVRICVTKTLKYVQGSGGTSRLCGVCQVACCLSPRRSAAPR